MFNAAPANMEAGARAPGAPSPVHPLSLSALPMSTNLTKMYKPRG